MAPMASSQGGLPSRGASLPWKGGRGWQVGAQKRPNGEVQLGQALAEEPGGLGCRERGERGAPESPSLHSQLHRGKQQGQAEPRPRMLIEGAGGVPIPKWGQGRGRHVVGGV